ncbi:MAG: OmpA family protein [Bacteroidota bacterium]
MLNLRIFLFIAFLFPVFLHAQDFKIQQVHFASDEAQLDSNAVNTIFDLRAGLTTAPDNYKVFLVGHTDNKGSLAYNEQLSKRRAESVQTMLVELGFTPNQIELSYKAFLDPLDDSDNEAARAKNRRVDLILESNIGQVSRDFFLVDAQAGGSFTYSRSKTTINIPPNAFVDENNQAVIGEVVITYREFRDYADFMLTDLPMNFNWEGEAAYFNSAGMFDLKAYDLKKNSLLLASDKTVALSFEQVELLEGTEFWRFDEKLGEWSSGNPYVEYNSGDLVRVQTGTRREKLGDSELRWPEAYRWNFNKDTIGRLQEAHTLLREILTTTEAYRYAYIPQLDVNRFKHRVRGKAVLADYAGTDYIGHLSFPEAYSNADYYNIELDFQTIEDEKKLQFKIKDLSDKNPELSAFEDVLWTVNKKKLKKQKKLDILTNRFADVRVRRTEKGDYLIHLKHKSKLYTIAAVPSLSEAIASDLTFEDCYANYARTYRQRQKDFDLALETQLEKALLLWPCIQLLLPNEIPADLAMLEAIKPVFKKWESNYESYWPNAAPSSTKGLHLDQVPAYKFLRKGGRFFKPYLTGDLLTDTAWRDKISATKISESSKYVLLTFQGDVPLYKEVCATFDQPIPVLQLRGLGVFNLDVLKRFEEEKRLLARFETEDGELLSILKTEVINHRLNGLLRFNSPMIYLDVKSPTTIVVQDVQGRAYYLNPDDIAQYELADKKRVTFQLKPLGNFVENPDIVRDLINWEG